MHKSIQKKSMEKSSSVSALLHLYCLLDCGQGSMHFVDSKYIYPALQSPISSSLQSIPLWVLHYHLKFSIYKTELIISPDPTDSLLYPASHSLFFRNSPFPWIIPLFSLKSSKTLDSTLISSSFSPLNVLNQQILIIFPADGFSMVIFPFCSSGLIKSYTNYFSRFKGPIPPFIKHLNVPTC